MLPRVFRDRRVRFLLAAGVVFGAGLSVMPGYSALYRPVYLCPLCHPPAGYAPHARVEPRRPATRIGGGTRYPGDLPDAGRASPVRRTSHALHPSLADHVVWHGTAGSSRARVLTELEGYPAATRHCQIWPDHAPFDDWVYNAADIDKSKVVWAREKETGNESDLLRYFHDRRSGW